MIISPASPWPARRGYQLRAAHLAETLATRHAVTIVAQHDGGTPEPPASDGIDVRLVPHGSASKAVGALGVARRPVQVALHRQAALQRAVAETLAANRPDVAVLVLSRLGDVVPVLSDVPLVIDFVDALALNMKRRAEREPLLAPLWRWEAKRMAAWDRRLLASAHAGMVVANRDRAALLDAETVGTSAVPIHVVPLGMAIPATPRPLPSGPPRVVLTGNLGYFPTVEGATWFAERVWPRVRQALPTARWCLAGARPAASLRALDGQAGIDVVANPPDLDGIRRQGHLAIAPLRAGSGTPIKVLEAMADGVPVVTTAGGVAGLDEVPEEALAVASNEEEMVQLVVELLGAPERAEAQAARAKVWLTQRHDWHAVGRRFESILERAAGQAPPR